MREWRDRNESLKELKKKERKVKKGEHKRSKIRREV